MIEEKDGYCATTGDTCCSGEARTIVVACSGASNVGQISNNVMIELSKRGYGDAYCLAGVGARISGFVETAKAAKTIIIDGCPVGCGKKVFEQYDIQPTRYIVVTELGIEKTHNFDTVSGETNDLLARLLPSM